MSRFTAIAAMLSASLAACATRPGVPASTAAPFVLEEALVGRSVGEGVITTITGGRTAFTAYLEGTWDGETLTLVEDFEYEDGTTDRKTWRISKTGEGEYTGTREDVVGEARGYIDGDAFRLEYMIDLEMGQGGKRRLGFRDVLTVSERGVIINDANIGWFGVHVGRVNFVIRRAEGGE